MTPQMETAVLGAVRSLISAYPDGAPLEELVRAAASIGASLVLTLSASIGAPADKVCQAVCMGIRKAVEEARNETLQ